MNPKIIFMAKEVGLVKWLAILLATILVGVFALILPVRGTLNKSRTDIKSLLARIHSTEKSVRELKNFDTVLAMRRQELEELQNKTIQAGENSKVVSLITKLTEQLKVSIRNMKLVPESGMPKPGPDDWLKPLAFDIELVSTYQSLGSLLEYLEEAPIAVAIKQMTTEPDDTGGTQLVTKMRLLAFEEVTPS